MYGGFVEWEKGDAEDGSDSIAKQVIISLFVSYPLAQAKKVTNKFHKILVYKKTLKRLKNMHPTV